MTAQEFSDQFDVLYNNITSNQAPGLNEYEKSVFLTKAQDEIVQAYFNPKANKSLEGFDGSERRQIDFSMLMRTIQPAAATASTDIQNITNEAYYVMPADILLYINEAVLVTRNTSTIRLNVVPVSYTEYNRLMSKPYKRPLKNQAWRLISSGGSYGFTYNDYVGLANAIYSNAHSSYSTFDASLAAAVMAGNIISRTSTSDSKYYIKVGSNKYLQADNTLDTTTTNAIKVTGTVDPSTYMNKSVGPSSTVVELVPGPNDTITQYIVRYVARPTPIITDNLANEGVTVNGQTAQMSCMLDPILHQEILQRAVELAKAAYTGDLNSQLALGTASETDKGILPRYSSKSHND